MTFWQDLRYASRLLVRKPGFTIALVLFFALGIGANTAIFSVVDSMLSRPLPFDDHARLVMVWNTSASPGQGIDEYPASPSNFLEWRRQNEAFQELAAMEMGSLNLTGRGEPLRIEVAEVTANLFNVLGVEPLHGRAFSQEEDLPGAERVVVVSHSLWQGKFGGDPELVGKDLQLSGNPTTVIGIMPPEMRFPDEVEMWVPLRLDPSSLAPWHVLLVVSRLREGVSLEQAQSSMDVIAQRLREADPGLHQGWGISVKPLRGELVGELRGDLLLLFGAVGFVLAIACANVSNLFLVRVAQRGREMAVRLALGVRRGRLLRQLLTECVLLSFLGGLTGLALAWFSLQPALSLSQVEIPSYMNPGIDSRVLLFTFLTSVLTGVIFGLTPALRGLRVDLNHILKEGGRGALSHRSRLMSGLVVIEVALALMLLSGAGLLIKSFRILQAVDPGFEVQNLLTMKLSLPRSKYPQAEQRAAFFEQALAELNSLPGVDSATLTTTLPLSRDNISGVFSVEGQDPSSREEEQIANSRMVSPGYFKLMGIQQLQGRDFTTHDNQDRDGVVIVSQEMARRYWPSRDPVGRRVKRGRLDSESPWLTVVGVVSDVQDAGLQEDVGSTWYMPYAQNSWGTAHLVLRTKTQPLSVVQSAREAIWRVDRDQPVYDVATLEKVVGMSLSRPRFKTYLFGAFAALALLLAAVGVYGVISFSANERTQEVGIRMALGSDRRQVWTLVVKHGMSLTALGLSLGFLGSFLLSRYLASSLYQVSPFDPGTMLTVCAVLLGASFLATFLPAYWATRVDPIVALRWE